MLDGESSEAELFRAWLCTIARNVVRNYIRDKKRDVVGRAASLDRMADMSSGQSEPVEAVIDKEQQAVIRRSLEEIPDRDGTKSDTVYVRRHTGSSLLCLKERQT